ncbi:obscurin-like [Equus quagga]|uniref:obscurin-like n=1 Tax=Equus quagga TaxID=89248 RepID=UPI001EE3344A|nr:obscurin-like [Equus quagga]XP_046506350.1 obscurin-like [Equus quagga]XP_046506388.1 obscurin-like [Equus quagga]XP_046506390.1 obscurin-like [Equus quagga]
MCELEIHGLAMADAGEYSCMCGQERTSATLTVRALPAKFTKGLRKEEATEGATATLRCELSKAVPVEWRKGSDTLRAGDRVSLRQDGAVCELEIRGLALTDAGEYSCVCGKERTSATLTVRGKDRVWPSQAVFRRPVIEFMTSVCVPSMFSPISVSLSPHNSLEFLPLSCCVNHRKLESKPLPTPCGTAGSVLLSCWVLCLFLCPVMSCF